MEFTDNEDQLHVQKEIKIKPLTFYKQHFQTVKEAF